MMESKTIGLYSLWRCASSHLAMAMTNPSKSCFGHSVWLSSIADKSAINCLVWKGDVLSRSERAHPSAPRATAGLKRCSAFFHISTVKGGTTKGNLGMNAWTKLAMRCHVSSLCKFSQVHRGFQKCSKHWWTCGVMAVWWWNSKLSPTEMSAMWVTISNSSTDPCTARGWPWKNHWPSCWVCTGWCSKMPLVLTLVATTSNVWVSQNESTCSGRAFRRSWKRPFIVLSFLAWRIFCRCCRCHLSNSRNAWWKAW